MEQLHVTAKDYEYFLNVVQTQILSIYEPFKKKIL